MYEGERRPIRRRREERALFVFSVIREMPHKLSVDLVRHCPPRVPRASPLKLITGKRSSRIRFPSSTTTNCEGNTDAARLGAREASRVKRGFYVLTTFNRVFNSRESSLNEGKKAILVKNTLLLLLELQLRHT